MVWQKKKKKVVNHLFCSPVKRERVPKKNKKWIERIPLLQVYFSHFIAKQGTIFKDICFKQGTQFCSACSSSGLIYYGPANWSFRRQIPCANCFIIIIYYEVFLYFFFHINFPPKMDFSAFWHKKISRHLVKGVCSLKSGVLQGLVKIC